MKNTREQYLSNSRYNETGTVYNNITPCGKKTIFKIVKTGCTENLNLNLKPGCLQLVSALCSMLLLIPKMDLVLSS